MKKLIIICLFLRLCLDAAWAQNSRLYGSGEFGAGEMSCNLINDICQDSCGFIWIATEYGLNKFDGVRFSQYLHNDEDASSLLGNNVRTLMIDGDRTLWIGCSNGLQRFDSENDTFTPVSFLNNNNTNTHVTDMVKLPSGTIWITTSGKGLFALEKDAREALPVEEVNRLSENGFLSCIYRDSRQYVWVGTNEDGLFRINPATGETQVFPLSQPINDIIEDGERQLYIITSTAVFMLDPSANRFVLLPGGNGSEPIFPRKMALSHSGNIFITTDGQGLIYIDSSQKRWHSVENSHTSFNFNTARIHALMEDRDMNLWLGCFQKGILMMPNEPMQFDFWSLPGNEYKLRGAVTSICKDYQGAVWCSIDNEGIFRFDEKGRVMKHFLPTQSIAKIFEDSNHTLWVSWLFDKKLAQINPATGALAFLPAPHKGSYIKTMAEDRNKCLYFSTFSSGFIRYHLATGKWEPFDLQRRDTTKGDLGNRWINAMICDSKGLMWFGHYVGVNCYDPGEDRFIKTGLETVLSGQICLSLLEDHAGNIWAGTYNGLFRMDVQTGNVKNYTTGDGLSNNVICGLEEDREGNIWCSTFQGINQIKVKENRIINFYTGNGLVDKIYNRGVHFRDKDGKIYFGGNTGITLFSPEKITVSSYDREIRVTNLYVHNQPVNAHTLSGGKPVMDGSLAEAKKFRFSYEDNTFTIEFSTVDFRDPENIHYEYRIKDLSRDWSVTPPRVNRITYNHLPPGHYTLEVRAGKYGAYSQVKQLSLQIFPPWYLTHAAYAGYFFLLAAVCLLIVYLINKKRKEVVSEAKLRFFIDISHEIRSPMTLIISPLEKLLKENRDPSARKTLEGMQRNAKRILGLVNQLLDIRKIDKGQMHFKYNETDLVRFIEELFDVFEDQASRRNIRFTFEHHTEELSVWIDRNNFDKVLMNLLSNAFKFTPDNGEINLLLTSGIDEGTWGALRHFAEIRIIDSGTGIDEEKIEKIFTRFYQARNNLTFGSMGSGIGLNLARTLVELHQGTITASNRKDVKGSCFTIRIPLGKNHLKKEHIAKDEPDPRVIPRPEAIVRQAETKRKPVRSKTNYKLLIVDDEEEIRDFLRQELEDTYKVISASNGNEALPIVLSQLPDLIVSDIMMPGMDGFTFVKKLKSNSNVSHIPVILLSSKTEHHDRMQGLDQGADAYLTKPFHIEELLVRINNLINNRRMLKGKFSGAQDQQDKVKSVDFKSSDEILMERIMSVINDNISNPGLNVELLVSKIGLSRVQLHRKLKELTGIPAGDFIRNIRLKQAAELLKGKKMNISQIAYAVGFANQTHFSTAFKKFYGISPTEYMAQIM
ncbi:MAG: response regulator [Tannerellaceae bacterium]|jgi:signal transduction histidine kinase/ligand-binding sensor domain-containing protein/AraC-like DNA-binding protein|nr:response regulator [Tannerellaceae bacterium]